jgi:hypothetical protein
MLTELWHARNGRNAPPPAGWTHIYWPVALLVSFISFFGAEFFHPSLRGPALILGMVVLLVPEITVAVLRQWQNTLSDWVWNTVHVARNQPISKWNAEHFLTFGFYCVIAASVDAYVWQLGITAFVTALMMSIWLAFHFFLQWWA